MAEATNLEAIVQAQIQTLLYPHPELYLTSELYGAVEKC